MKLNRFDVIVALYIFAIVTVQLMGAKVVPFVNFFGVNLSISVAIFLMPLLFTVTDVVVEIYGKERARSLVWTGMMIIVLLIAYTMLSTSLPAANRFLPTNDAYNTIFGTSIRLAIASIFAFASAEMIDVLIYSKLREKMKQKGMWLRNNVSNFIGQFIDSSVFMIIAFYSFDISPISNYNFLIGIILPYWIVKCLMSVIGTPLAYAGVAYLRKRDTAKS